MVHLALVLLVSCARARPPSTPLRDFVRFNCASWLGRAVSIDVRTAEPSFPEIAYALEQRAPAESDPCTFATSARLLGDGAREYMATTTLDLRADVDIDGSYSVDYLAGAHPLAQLLRDAAGGDQAAACSFVIEHSLAVDEEQRLRCLLLYDDASSRLAHVFLLREARAADAADVSRAPPAAAPCTLYSLLGSWRGDACVRKPLPSPAPKPRGFGARKSTDLLDGGFGHVGTNVFKASVTWGWDGHDAVARSLGFTPFVGAALEPITSVGVLETHEGRFGAHEAVAFGRAADSSAPRMLLLQAGCYVLAPTQLPARLGAFSTEFGAVLEPGESFGLQSFGGEAGAAEAGPADADADAADGEREGGGGMRLVRIGRLYKGERQFASGTTSFCTAVAPGESAASAEAPSAAAAMS